MVQTSTWREALGGAELPIFLFEQTEKFARSVLKNGFEKLDVEKLKVFFIELKLILNKHLNSCLNQ